MSLETDLRTYLLTTGVSGLSTNNVFVGPTRKSLPGTAPGVRCVSILETAGYQPHEWLDGGVSNTRRISEAQVRVRGLPNDYLNTKTLADSVWLKFQKVSSASITGRTYIRVFNLHSAPLYAGVDDLERDEFFINVRAENGS